MRDAFGDKIEIDRGGTCTVLTLHDGEYSAAAALTSKKLRKLAAKLLAAAEEMDE